MIKRNLLKQKCQELGISLCQLSFKTKIAQGNISKIANHKIYVSQGWKDRICEALGLEEKEIFPE